MNRHMAELLKQVVGHDDFTSIRFYATGRLVYIRSATSDGPWCDFEPLHTTEEARWQAERKAEMTATALNEYLAAAIDA